MENLIFITNHFPFGNGESFIQNEFYHLIARCNRAFILSRNVNGSQTGNYPGTEHVYRMSTTSRFRDYFVVVGAAIRNLPTLLRFLNEEYNSMHSRKIRISLFHVRQALHDLGKALLIARKIEEIIKENQVRGKVTIYSYWMNNAALASLFVKEKSPATVAICRAHGGDVFEFRHRNNYLSFRSTLIRHLNGVYSISSAGAKHLEGYTQQQFYSHIKVNRLGTPARDTSPLPSRKNQFTIVSCAFVGWVKRITLLIDALLLTELTIHWVHIGDGPLLKETMVHAEKLSSNPRVSFSFHGFYTPEQILQFYRDTPVDLFVNTSESEGIPVSIMEANSFGIPAVAPNVGGIPEIVNDTTGALFPVHGGASSVAGVITRILTLPEDKYLELRRNAFENWQANFNADRNFPTFVADILALDSNETE